MSNVEIGWVVFGFIAVACTLWVWLKRLVYDVESVRSASQDVQRKATRDISELGREMRKYVDEQVESVYTYHVIGGSCCRIPPVPTRAEHDELIAKVNALYEASKLEYKEIPVQRKAVKKGGRHE